MHRSTGFAGGVWRLLMMTSESSPTDLFVIGLVGLPLFCLTARHPMVRLLRPIFRVSIPVHRQSWLLSAWVAPWLTSALRWFA